MSDSSSGWSTSDEDSSGNEYSIRTKKDKLEEIEQKKTKKKSKKKRKKRKKEKKGKRGKEESSDESQKDENQNKDKKNEDKKRDTKKDTNVEAEDTDTKTVTVKNEVKSEPPDTPIKKKSQHSKSRSRSREKKKSRSRSKEKKRSRSRSKDKKRSRSRSKEKKRSRSRSKEKRRSRSQSKEKKKSGPQSKEKKRSRSRSKDKKKSRSRSKEKRRSRSQSKDKKRSASPSKSKKYKPSSYRSKSRSRSPNRPTCHSRERSRERTQRTSYDYNKRSRVRSKSPRVRRGRSRSLERRRERSRSLGRRDRSKSRDRRDTRRSRSRERKRSRSKSFDSKRIKREIRTPSPKKDLRLKLLQKSGVEVKTEKDTPKESKWDVKVATPDSTTAIPGGSVGQFLPINNTTTPDGSKTTDGDFSHAKPPPVPSKGGIVFNIPPPLPPPEKKERVDPKEHVYGKWEKHEPPAKEGKRDLSKFMRMCQEISAKEGVDEPPASVSSDEEVVHHPFAVKPAPMYTPLSYPTPKVPMNPAQAIMAGSMVSLTRTEPEMTGPLEKHFPVSSGTDHRDKCNSTATDINAASAVVYEEKEEAPQENINVSALIARRLGAQQILTANAQDYSAQLVMAECDQKLKKWSDRNKKPGKFTGEVQMNKMNKKAMFQVGSNEGNIGKDFFHNLRPVTGGIGMKILQHMGWKEGQALGKTMQGFVDPISFDVKFGRSGLHSQEEVPQQWPQTYQTPTHMGMGRGMTPKKRAAPIVNCNGKHPISALAEHCQKTRKGFPEYNMRDESGITYSKQFLMQVQIENIVYQPTESSTTKKHAKAMAAMVALQALGLLPK